MAKPMNNGTFPKNEEGEVNESSAFHDSLTLEKNLNKAISKRLKRQRNRWTLIVTFLALILIVIFVTVAFLVAKGLLLKEMAMEKRSCKDETFCQLMLAETIPASLEYNSRSTIHDKISDHWQALVASATSNIDILSFYWTLKSSDVKGGPYREAKAGEDFFKALHNAAKAGIKIRIVQTPPSKEYPQLNTKNLSLLQHVEVRSLDMSTLVGAGVIHTKMFIVDKKHMYVGSANFDWRALSAVKELGVILYNCSCTGGDLQKIFETNWLLAEKGAQIPRHWPSKYQTDYSRDNPIKTTFNGVSTDAYWSTSPTQFCPPNRSTDISAILDLINSAQKFIYIAVMNYQAAVIFSQPRVFWPIIDNALRSAVYNRGVTVKFLSSRWTQTPSEQIAFLKSLASFDGTTNNGDIIIKMFTMPESDIPYSGVNHNKYMVTESASFISTSNWSGDYFLDTAGVSLVFNQTGSVHDQLRKVFERDWDSKYALDLDLADKK